MQNLSKSKYQYSFSKHFNFHLATIFLPLTAQIIFQQLSHVKQTLN